MTRSEAYDLLPADAKWSASFGYPGEGGYCEYHRTADGKRYAIENGPWDSVGNEWTCTEIVRNPTVAEPLRSIINSFSGG